MSSSDISLEKDAEKFKELFDQLKNEIKKIVVGQDEIVNNLLISLFSKGHCVLVGVPGLAKTLLIRTLSEALNLSFNRIQFTPDLMPGDITGTEIIEEDPSSRKKVFKFIKGPLFANIILADEINRTPPKTQSALLEAMQEYQVTAAGIKYELKLPFFVLATQNPIEQEGTYPLPEAQLDRFMFNLRLDYPPFEDEINIVKNTTSTNKTSITPVLDATQIIGLQNLTREVPVPDGVLRYAVKLVNMTRPASPLAPDIVKKYVSWGAGPRASQYLVIGGKSRALSEGRYHITENDINAIAKPVLRHRIVSNYAAEADGITTDELIDKLIALA